MAVEESCELDIGQKLARIISGINYDPFTGKFNGAGFLRLAKDSDGLSVTACGYYSASKKEDESIIRSIMASWMNLRKSHNFAIVDWPATKNTLLQAGIDVKLQPDPIPAEGSRLANPAHFLIVGLPVFPTDADSDLAGDLISSAVVGRFAAVV